MLETLAHAGIGRVPKTHVAIEIRIAGDVTVERLEASRLPSGWAQPDQRVARLFGDAWIRERRTAVLVVPSVVARTGANVLLNPLHPEFKKIVDLLEDVARALSSDERLRIGVVMGDVFVDGRDELGYAGETAPVDPESL